MTTRPLRTPPFSARSWQYCAASDCPRGGDRAARVPDHGRTTSCRLAPWPCFLVPVPPHTAQITGMRESLEDNRLATARPDVSTRANGARRVSPREGAWDITPLKSSGYCNPDPAEDLRHTSLEDRYEISWHGLHIHAGEQHLAENDRGRLQDAAAPRGMADRNRPRVSGPERRPSVLAGTASAVRIREPGSALQFELQFAHVRRRPPKSTQARDLRQRTSEDGQRIRAADS